MTNLRIGFEMVHASNEGDRNVEQACTNFPVAGGKENSIWVSQVEWM